MDVPRALPSPGRTSRTGPCVPCGSSNPPGKPLILQEPGRGEHEGHKGKKEVTKQISMTFAITFVSFVFASRVFALPKSRTAAYVAHGRCGRGSHERDRPLSKHVRIARQ